MKLDRELQRKILEVMRESYPGVSDEAFDAIQALANDTTLYTNMRYLEEHGLIMSGIAQYADNTIYFTQPEMRITAKGLDFLADDGGLSAILGVVTIRLHDDQVRLMLASRIQESDAPEEEKRKWLDQLREIPADATKHLVHKLIDAGLAQWPVVLAAMQTLTK